MRQPKLSLETIDPASIDWNPKPDITAYELARCMQLLIYMVHEEGSVDPVVKVGLLNWLPKEVQRHFNYRYKKA